MFTVSEFFAEGLRKLLDDIPDSRKLPEAELSRVAHDFTCALARQQGQRIHDAIEEMPLHQQQEMLRSVCLPDRPASYLHTAYDDIVHRLLKAVADHAASAAKPDGSRIAA